MQPSSEFPLDIREVLAVLARIPYENLSKAVDYNFHRVSEEALMVQPQELLRKHEAAGAGGTCFSLTWFLVNHLTSRGYSVYPVMCDRSYGKNTHCCAILEYRGLRYLLDPGYLSFTPILLDDHCASSLDTVFNSILLAPAGDRRFSLNTVYLKENKYRFTLKDEKISNEAFFRYWKESFLWESLTYPVATMLKEDAHLYFQKEHLYVRRKAGSEKIWVPPEKMADTLEKCFGIKPELTRKAIELFY